MDGDVLLMIVAIVGALAAAVALELLKRGFAFQVARLPTYTMVYGTFATLPLLLIWLFLLWMTVLAGALVTASLPSLRGEGLPGAPRTPAQWFEMAHEVLLQLARPRPGAVGGPAGRCAVIELRGAFSGNAAWAERVGSLLRELGYIDRCWSSGGSGEEAEPAAGATTGAEHVWREHWMLAGGTPPPTLRPLFERLWRGNASGALDVGELDLPLADLASALRTGSGPAACP